MQSFKYKIVGFTLIELMIAIGIIGILAAIAVPIYINSTRRAYYSEIMQALAPYEVAVAQCIGDTNSTAPCSANYESIPANITSPPSATSCIGSITTANGTITAVNNTAAGATCRISSVQALTLTPSFSSTSAVVTWSYSGLAVINGYVQSQ